ncbi:MAG TPA: hypothetical protein VFO93_06140, partial [Hymenobacter sp.]|nr:hypothetical protein [Hymenobacter sp.]
DFDTNSDIDNPSKPLSHAALVKRYIEKKYPELATLTFKESDLQGSANQIIVKARVKKSTATKGKKIPVTKSTGGKRSSGGSQLSIL